MLLKLSFACLRWDLRSIVVDFFGSSSEPVRRLLGKRASARVGAVCPDRVLWLETLWLCAVFFVILPPRVLRGVLFDARGVGARSRDAFSGAEASAVASASGSCLSWL